VRGGTGLGASCPWPRGAADRCPLGAPLECFVLVVSSVESDAPRRNARSDWHHLRSRRSSPRRCPGTLGGAVRDSSFRGFFLSGAGWPCQDSITGWVERATPTTTARRQAAMATSRSIVEMGSGLTSALGGRQGQDGDKIRASGTHWPTSPTTTCATKSRPKPHAGAAAAVRRRRASPRRRLRTRVRGRRTHPRW
jgi:hypothetical protein